MPTTVTEPKVPAIRFSAVMIVYVFATVVLALTTNAPAVVKSMLPPPALAMMTLPFCVGERPTANVPSVSCA